MNSHNFHITPATREDAPFIARTVMGALGDELCLSLAGSKDRLPLVKQVFTELAEAEQSQYSYRNTLIAKDDNGQTAGCIIAYDGARLHSLRRAFVEKANDILGWNVSAAEEAQWGDEADAGEVYIDSLYVEPPYRRSGVGKALIMAATSLHAASGKPMGLLCEPENERAYRLYRSLGFEEVGISHFFRTPMKHLQLRQAPR